MYIYESHMGGLYVAEEAQPDKYLYCETCGDYDWLIGVANTREEAWNLLKDDVDINNSGGWDYDYVNGILDAYFGGANDE